MGRSREGDGSRSCCLLMGIEEVLCGGLRAIWVLNMPTREGRYSCYCIDSVKTAIEMQPESNYQLFTGLLSD